MRRAWVQVNGELIPKEEYHADIPKNVAPEIMPDIKGYHSVITNEWIGSRSTHRNHLKQHGCFEIGNEKIQERKPVDAPNLRDDIARVVYGR